MQTDEETYLVRRTKRGKETHSYGQIDTFKEAGREIYAERQTKGNREMKGKRRETETD